MFDLIERLVVWENANDESLLKQAHAEIAASVGYALLPHACPESLRPGVLWTAPSGQAHTEGADLPTKVARQVRLVS